MMTPGTTFQDESGATAQLHGIGLQRFGDRFWAWGEDKRSGSTFSAVAAYSSDDLVTWRFEGDALRAEDTGDLAPDRIVERPKVLQRPDGTFVMLLHLDRVAQLEDGSYHYVDARVGYALSANPQGPFTFVHGERPLGFESRDIGVYQEDGVGYLLSEDRIHGTAIYRLSADYLSVEEHVALIVDDGPPDPGYESPTLIKHEGTYYLFASQLTGWATNDNIYATAPSLAGPWSPWQHFAPVGTSTWDSQVSVVLPVVGTDGITRYLYVGDRWTPQDLANSPAVWLPLSIENGVANLPWRESWDPVAELALG